MNDNCLYHAAYSETIATKGKYRLRIVLWAKSGDFEDRSITIHWYDQLQENSEPYYRRAFLRRMLEYKCEERGVLDPVSSKRYSCVRSKSPDSPYEYDAWPYQNKLPKVYEKMPEEYKEKMNVWVVTLDSKSPKFWYLLHLKSNEKVYWWGKGGLKEESEGRPDKRCFEVNVIDNPYPEEVILAKTPTTKSELQPPEQPDWIEGITVYQIFLDRFAKGNENKSVPEPRLEWGEKPHLDYPRVAKEHAGGDLAGIKKHLNHLRELGVGTVYITPIFKSPTNHKYDTEDYTNIDASFGVEKNLVELVHEAHKSGIKVLLDGVFNHCSDKLLINGVRPFEDVIVKGERSRYRSWFHFDEWSDTPRDWKYECFWAVKSIPKFNTDNSECAAYLLEVATQWMEKAGIDGWRLDTARDVSHKFWKLFRKTVKSENPDAWIIGEILWGGKEYLLSDELDSLTSIRWGNVILDFIEGFNKDRVLKTDAQWLDGELQYLLHEEYTPQIFASLVQMLGNHDTMRVQTRVGPARARLAAILLFTSPGIPLVYYGDEIGMEGGHDPDCRRCMEWNREKWNGDTFELYKKLIKIRRERPWLRDGGWETLLAEGGRYAFRRSSHPTLGKPTPHLGESLWVIVNRSHEKFDNPPVFPLYKDVGLESIEKPSALIDLLTEERIPVTEPFEVQIGPFDANILVPVEEEGLRPKRWQRCRSPQSCTRSPVNSVHLEYIADVRFRLLYFMSGMCVLKYNWRRSDRTGSGIRESKGRIVTFLPLLPFLPFLKLATYEMEYWSKK